jgi:hypothetical protein
MTVATRFLSLRLLGWACLISITPALAYGQKSSDEPTKKNSDAKADEAMQSEYQKLESLLSNCTMIGHFTVDGNDSPPKAERYELRSVKKLPLGDLWLLQARIKYGDHDVTVPLTLPILWAGKTPIITVDNITIPGLGTFNSRVVISDGKYAGTWQHGDVGGHLFGKIERAETTEQTPAGEKSDAQRKPEAETSDGEIKR